MYKTHIPSTIRITPEIWKKYKIFSQLRLLCRTFGNLFFIISVEIHIIQCRVIINIFCIAA